MSILCLLTLYDICLLLSGDMTGRYSVYTIYEGHEIMFHVSTLLPYSKENRQQVSSLFRFHVGILQLTCLVCGIVTSLSEIITLLLVDFMVFRTTWRVAS